MIIELFGPPGVGKSTLSRSLADALKTEGYDVRLIMSERPGEMGRGNISRAAPLRRLWRAAFQIARAALSGRLNCALAFAKLLLTSFPQNGFVRTFRVTQYLVRVDYNWHRASRLSAITIFDQAYIQTLYSLATRAEVSDPNTIKTALNILPRPTFVINVHAPMTVLAARLAARHDKQGAIERLFENDAQPFINDEKVLQTVREHLIDQGQRMLTPWLDNQDCANAATTIVADIVGARKIIQKPMTNYASEKRSPIISQPVTSQNTFLKKFRMRKIAVTVLIFLGIGAIPLALITASLSPSNALHPLIRMIGYGDQASTRHYASQDNFDGHGRYAPARAGFNLADVATVEQLKALPPGVQALVWIGLCGGADAAFKARITPYLGQKDVWGFYLMDDPDPTGAWHPRCMPEDLAAEADWIHAHMASAKTFVALMNGGTLREPSFRGGYTVKNSHVDLFGLAVYPCREPSKGCDFDAIDRFVAAARSSGIAKETMVPIIQAFGGGTWKEADGGAYALPSAQETEQLMARWSQVLPDPAFDYAYSWGRQRGDQALVDAPDSIEVFRRHNAGPNQNRSGLLFKALMVVDAIN